MKHPLIGLTTTIFFFVAVDTVSSFSPNAHRRISSSGLDPAVGQRSPINIDSSTVLTWGIYNHYTSLYSSTSPTTDSGTAASGSRGNRGNNERRRNDNNNNNYNNNRRSSGGGGGGGSGGGGMPALRLENPMKVRHIRLSPPPQQPRQQRQDRRKDEGGGGGGRGQRGGGGGGGRGPVASAGTATRVSRPPKPSSVGTDDTGGGDGGSKASSSGEDYGYNIETTADGGRGIKKSKYSDDGGSDGDSGASRGDGKKRRQPNSRKNSREDRDATADGRNSRKTSLKIGTGKSGRAASISSRRGSLRKRDRSAEKEAKEEAALERRTVVLPEGPLTVSQLAEAIDEKPVAIIKFLMADLGVMASMTQSLDPATCVAICEGFGKIVGGSDDDDEDEDEDIDEESALALGFVADDDEEEDLEPRAPVVTIMGHVDHGKTSLLDAIRNTRVTSGEAGGITQHIAAYRVDHQGDPITFIDTPGHAAFTDMRERGANITDIVILVVAADDGVKQQTADSIACARQAGVPLVVAINKCDLETADPNRVMSELTTYDVLIEDLGGDVLCSEISAKEGTGLDDLLDKIMLQAEVEDLKANPERNAEAIVVEALVERGLGTVATSLVKKGTLRVGDIFVAGETYGRVRTLISTNDGKTRLKEVGPSVPVRIVGFEGVPAAGDSLVVVEDEQTARLLAENRQRIARERSSATYQDSLMDTVAMTFGSTKERREMCVVVKADVQGSAEALTRSLRELRRENEEAVVTVKVLVSQAGDVSKSDIAIAAVTPGTTVIAFNVAASYEAMESARAQDIPIEYYSIVYDAIESVESRMQEVLSPTPEGEYSGSALVQEVFNIGGLGNIAGSRCEDGVLRKGGNVRVMRGDKILTETKIKSLRNFKAEADSIEAGNECGIGLIDFEEFQSGDVIECYIE